MEFTTSAKGRLAYGKRRCFPSLFSYSFFSSPTTSIESYNLVSAFLLPKLEGSFTVIRLPPNEDKSQGQMLALLVAMYGLKYTPSAFLRALGDQMASFTYDAQHEPVNRAEQRQKKKYGPGNVGLPDPTDSNLPSSSWAR